MHRYKLIESGSPKILDMNKEDSLVRLNVKAVGDYRIENTGLFRGLPDILIIIYVVININDNHRT